MYAPDLTERLPGEAWLHAQRADAAVRASASPMPTQESEEWRYSPIDDLVLDHFAPALEAPVDPDLAVTLPIEGAAAVVDTANGFLVRLDVHDDRVVVQSASTLDDVAGYGVADGHDVFSTTNEAFAPDPIVVRVRAGVDIDGPIVITHRLSAAGSAAFPRLLVDVGADASVSVVEVFVSDDVDALTVPVTQITVGDAARVKYQQVQDLGPAVIALGSLGIDIGAQATFAGGIAALGGSYARVRTDCRLNGRGATGDLAAVYYGDGDQILDFRTFQDHVGRDTLSNLLFKGVVDDASTSIYTGLIQVGKDAAGTNAFQTNRTIKLSEQAWAESVPNLEIENNDVRCSHASTVSPVDPEQRFYLESRGVPTAMAERLIVDGFLLEVVSRLPVEAVNEPLAALVQAKVDAKVGA